ncbi:MAG: metallophosphoesterase, partial [Candidatus Nanoarchaeia archaeon]|nr:metallophosphoesterase [Candidatus Nanoarchaeia archaeon]
MKLLLIGDFHGKIPKIKKEHENFDAILCTGDLPKSDELRKWLFKLWEKRHEGKKLHELMDKEKYCKIYNDALKSQIPILEWLNNWNKPVFFVYGNHDYDFNSIKDIKYLKNITSLNELIKNYKNIKLLVNKIEIFKEINIIGFSDSFSRHHKTEKFKKMWNKRLEKLFNKMNKKNFNIFLTHDTPQGVLDKIKDKNSPVY